MRPDSLAEVARRTLAGDSFDRCLGNFLDQFNLSPEAARVTEEPVLLEPKLGELGRVQDAYLAATAEELLRRINAPAPVWPAWIERETRKLHRPWFASQLAVLRAVLLLESPAGFRSRNLFVSENALTRV